MAFIEDIEEGQLLNTSALDLKIIKYSASKRQILKEMRELNDFTSLRFDQLYQQWKVCNGYLTFFKELKNSL
jgi:transcriptional regulator NrdR family protein